MTALALEEAYEIIHAAIIALGPKYDQGDRMVTCMGWNKVEEARECLEGIQRDLLRQIDVREIGRQPIGPATLTPIPILDSTMEKLARLHIRTGNENIILTIASVFERGMQEIEDD